MLALDPLTASGPDATSARMVASMSMEVDDRSVRYSPSIGGGCGWTGSDPEVKQEAK